VRPGTILWRLVVGIYILQNRIQFERLIPAVLRCLRVVVGMHLPRAIVFQCNHPNPDIHVTIHTVLQHITTMVYDWRHHPFIHI